MAKRESKQWYRRGTWWRRLRLNRKYKDVLFRKLFRNKQDLLDLYNALNGSTYTDPEELEVVTMEDVIFMKMKNDLSFIIGNSINFYEHQSTWISGGDSHRHLYSEGYPNGYPVKRESGGDIYALDGI